MGFPYVLIFGESLLDQGKCLKDDSHLEEGLVSVILVEFEV